LTAGYFPIFADQDRFEEFRQPAVQVDSFGEKSVRLPREEQAIKPGCANAIFKE